MAFRECVLVKDAAWRGAADRSVRSGSGAGEARSTEAARSARSARPAATRTHWSKRDEDSSLSPRWF